MVSDYYDVYHRTNEYPNDIVVDFPYSHYKGSFLSVFLHFKIYHYSGFDIPMINVVYDSFKYPGAIPFNASNKYMSGTQQIQEIHKRHAVNIHAPVRLKNIFGQTVINYRQ